MAASAHTLEARTVAKQLGVAIAAHPATSPMIWHILGVGARARHMARHRI